MMMDTQSVSSSVCTPFPHHDAGSATSSDSDGDWKPSSVCLNNKGTPETQSADSFGGSSPGQEYNLKDYRTQSFKSIVTSPRIDINKEPSLGSVSGYNTPPTGSVASWTTFGSRSNPALLPPFNLESSRFQDPDGLISSSPPTSNKQDPSGELMESQDGRLVNTAPGRYIPARQLSSKKQAADEKSFVTATSRTTLNTDVVQLPTQVSCSVGSHSTPHRDNKDYPPPRKHMLHINSSMEEDPYAILSILFDVPTEINSGRSRGDSTITGDWRFMGSARSATNSVNHGSSKRPIHAVPPKEFLLLVEFHWKSGGLFWKDIQPDHPTLPYVLHPYMKSTHWRKFLTAVVRLATRNHQVGTLYGLLGLTAIAAGLAYTLYGIIPSDNKFGEWQIAVGSGVALLTAGICLLIWGRANRQGGVLFVQDLETLCSNVTEQVPGVTMQFRTAATLKQRNDNDLDGARSLVFGLEIFCSDEATEMESSTNLAVGNGDAPHVMGGGTTDREEPSSQAAVSEMMV